MEVLVQLGLLASNHLLLHNKLKNIFLLLVLVKQEYQTEEQLHPTQIKQVRLPLLLVKLVAGVRVEQV